MTEEESTTPDVVARAAAERLAQERGSASAHALVEVVRTLIERWNARERDFATISAYFDPAVELESPLSSVVGTPYRGYAGIEKWVSDVDEQFAEWSIRPDDVRQAGNRVIAIATIHARGRASDLALQFPTAVVHDFGSDQRVTRMRIYPDVEEALQALGSKE